MPINDSDTTYQLKLLFNNCFKQRQLNARLLSLNYISNKYYQMNEDKDFVMLKQKKKHA